MYVTSTVPQIGPPFRSETIKSEIAHVIAIRLGLVTDINRYHGYFLSN